MDMMLDARGAAAFLGVGEEKLNEFVVNKIIPAYMIAGKFLRFKRSELKTIKDMLKADAAPSDERIFNKAFPEVRGREKFIEILRANDIYIIIGTAVLSLLIYMFIGWNR